MAKVTFRSTVGWDHEGVRSVASMKGKKLIIDEPAALGGTDQGPNPVELILSALGGCISVVINMLAPKYQVEIKDIRVQVEGDIDLDGFLEKNLDVRPGLQQIRYHVSVDSPAPSENVEKLIRHMERICPVKDTLAGVPVISQ